MWKLHVQVLLVALLGTLAFSLPVKSARAEIYKWTDERGNVHYSDETPDDRSTETVTPNTEKMGVEQSLDIQDLIYNDPDRADVAVWLRDHGWRSAALNSQDEMRRLGRFVDAANPNEDAFSTFVTAERT